MASDNRRIDGRSTYIGTMRTFNSNGTITNTLHSVDMGTIDALAGYKGNREVVNPLDIDHYTLIVPLMNGIGYAGGVPKFELISCPPAHKTGPTDPRSAFGNISNADKNEAAWTILSKTNPSRPHVNVPAALAELHDIPRLVKGYGDGLLKAVANGNLSYRFAIKPMIGDLTKMCKFAESVDKRMAYLTKLRDGKTLRTRCNLGATDDEVSSQRFTMQSQAATLYVRRKIYHSSKKWGSAEWKLKPDSVLYRKDMREMRNFARRLSAGVTSHGALETAWELTPWSWFVDWFSNVGDIIAATNNTVGCTWGRLALMRTSESRAVYEFDPVGSATWVTFDGWYNVRWQRKERHAVFPVVPIPLPSLPTLSGGQLSILLSLAALKR